MPTTSPGALNHLAGLVHILAVIVHDSEWPLESLVFMAIIIIIIISSSSSKVTPLSSPSYFQILAADMFAELVSIHCKNHLLRSDPIKSAYL